MKKILLLLAFFVATNLTAQLPVTWGKVEAIRANDLILIKWQTHTESGVSHFEIERSDDGINFEMIGHNIFSNGDSQQLANYIFGDNTVKKWKGYYYRIKQIDLDGNFDYSVVVFARQELERAVVFPNPFIDEFTVPGHVEGTRYQIIDSNGQVALETSQMPIKAHQLSSGMYYLILKDYVVGIIKE